MTSSSLTLLPTAVTQAETKVNYDKEKIMSCHCHHHHHHTHSLSLAMFARFNVTAEGTPLTPELMARTYNIGMITIITPCVKIFNKKSNVNALTVICTLVAGRSTMRFTERGLPGKSVGF